MNKFKISNKMPPKLIGNLEKGIVFVLSAPAGTGKTTLSQMICQEYKGHIVESISCTTREKREHEKNGVHYHFLSDSEFQTKVQNHEFLEYVHVFDHSYGTLKSEITSKIQKGIHVILVIDTQGAMKIKKMIDAVYIFLAPPSIEELERRLKFRQTETDSMIKKRLEWAEKEMSYAEHYDYFIINEDLQIAYQVLKSIVIAEEHRNRLS